ncbi:hypothetical protein ACOJVU_01900 [Mycobacterium sp. THU-M104]|uniref:hypothetical protein n=1 Tax=Mycobacterium sp. THU-M104 TaxID=3410515 RepID=UPI003B9BF178
MQRVPFMRQLLGADAAATNGDSRRGVRAVTPTSSAITMLATPSPAPNNALA